MRYYSTDVLEIVFMMRRHFRDINKGDGLTDEDKRQMKKFYLENLIAPKAREILKTHFPEEFNTGQRTAAPKSKPAS